MSAPDNLQHAEVEVPPVLAAQTAGQCGPDPASVAKAMGEAFGTLMGFLQARGIPMAGPPRAIYTAYGPEGVSFLVACPVVAPPGGISQDGPVTVSELPGGKALRFTHKGPYRELMKTYGQITQFMQAKGLLTSEADWAKYMPMWEEYLNDPQTTPEDQLLTYIYIPLP